MIDALPLLLGPEGYQISRSVRLRSSASGYFARTPSSNGNRTTWTWSGWVKRGALGSGTLFSAGLISGTFYYTTLGFGDQLVFTNYNDANTGWLTTTQVFRDPSAWYHIVAVFDSTNATNTERMRLYVNGVRITAFSTGTFPTTYPAQNTTSQMNTTSYSKWIGSYVRNGGSGSMFDGYLTEVNFIDGQALDPSSFGETNLVTGVWQPKKYAGTYGTNGFYLNFSDNSAATAAAIGKDNSGNGNNWTPNNISVTAGVTYDSMLDVPTQWADGGNGRGNYATLNPLQAGNAPSNGNLSATTSGTAHRNTLGTIFFPAAKFYYEISVAAIQRVSAGMATPQLSLTTVAAGQAQFLGIYGDSTGSTVYSGASSLFTQGAIAANDVYQFCIDPTTGNAWFGRNNTFYNSTGAATGNPAAGTNPTWTGVDLTNYSPEAGVYDAGTVANANFGQRPFAYTPPTGFKALNTLNLPTPTILKGNQYFDATLWTGNGTTQNITNSGGMQPDFLWVKTRSGTTVNWLVNAVTGASNGLISNSTAAEQNLGIVTSFNANGFSVSTIGGTNLTTNGNAATYVGWQWKEGPTQGFDIVTYSGTGAAQNVSHSLGVAPRMIIAKRRNAATNWFVGHGSLASWASALEGLNTTSAVNNGATAVFNSTAPTSSVFTVGIDLSASGGTYVAYLFSEVAGFSRFGSYVGNGSTDGPFCFTGFLPAFILYKNSSAASQWILYDTARNTYNAANRYLEPNTSDAENTSGVIDVLSNGFKIRQAGTDHNDSGNVYVYAAFASNPFKNSLAR
jgi:hypothetical protein